MKKFVDVPQSSYSCCDTNVKRLFISVKSQNMVCFKPYSYPQIFMFAHTNTLINITHGCQN